MTTATLVRQAVTDGRMSGRLWVYANYHCNITCTYCLTESGPKVPRREVGEDRLREIARQAADLGFDELGITGGEPFLLRYLPEVLLEATDLLPVVVLSNATLFTDRLIDRLRPLASS
jgi:MoaA/NifB/PqqE/SkfB family radical SAM enzyme